MTSLLSLPEIHLHDFGDLTAKAKKVVAMRAIERFGSVEAAARALNCRVGQIRRAANREESISLPGPSAVLIDIDQLLSNSNWRQIEGAIGAAIVRALEPLHLSEREMGRFLGISARTIGRLQVPVA